MGVVLVKSSAISQVEYHKRLKALDIYFRDGDFRMYENVPEEVYQQFLKAESKGTFFNYNIRDVYKYA